MTLHFHWTSLESQKGPNYWYQQSFFIWCLLRQRNGGLNSGLKSAIIVTDALFFKFGLVKRSCKYFDVYPHLAVWWPRHLKYKHAFMSNNYMKLKTAHRTNWADVVTSTDRHISVRNLRRIFHFVNLASAPCS